MKKLYFLLLSAFMCVQFAQAQLIINEISQGPTSAREYVELLVVGNRTCTDSTADIRKWIVDDNNGWLGAGSGQGIATGCLRFADDLNWSKVPYGSIILLYDDANKNAAITQPDDPTDADNDGVYIVPVSSLLIEKNTTSPTPPSSNSYTYPTTGFTAGGSWSYIGLANAGDGVVVVSPANRSSAVFSFGYGSLNNSSAATIYKTVAGSGIVYYLADALYANSASWIVGDAPSDETPGAPNTAANAAWISSMKVSVTPVVPVAKTDTLTGCGSITTNGTTYTVSGVINDTLKSVGGCDSIYRTLYLFINTATTQTVVINGCNSVVFNGITYTNSTVVTDTIRGLSGCDSIYMSAVINIQQVTPTTLAIDTAGCGSVVYNGITYVNTTTLRDTVKSVYGCDSVYNLVRIRVVKPVIQNNTLKGCGSVVFNGVTYTSQTLVRDTLKSVLGCDSIYRNNTILIQNMTAVPQASSFTACRSIVFNGTIYTASTVLIDTLKSSYGCDSVYRTVTIRIQDIAPVIQSAFLFGCDSVIYDNQKYTSSALIKDTLRSIYGCDSVIIDVNIRVSGAPVKDSSTLRGCDTLTFNGITYSDSTILRDTIKTNLGCDSIYKITNIIIRHVQPVSELDTLQGCNSFIFNGVTYTDSTIVADTLRTPEGCDSVYRTNYINIQKITPVLQDTTFKACRSVLYDTTTYTASTILLDTLRTTFGCDSVLRTVRIVIALPTPTVTSDTLRGCNSVVFGGNTYTTSTVVTDTVRTTEGCDSIYHRTNIIIRINATTQTTSFTSCSSIFYNGVNYTTSTIIRDTVRTAGGCDSIYKVTNIIIQNNKTTVTNNLTGCGSVLFNGVTYTSSVTLRDTVRTAQFCDSIYNINNIIVKNITPVTGNNAVSGCNSVVFNGTTYTASTTVQDTLRTPEGCDSVYRTNVITVRIVTPSTNTVVKRGCGSVTFNGITYTTSTVVRDTVRSVGSCDSIYNITTIDVVNPVASTNTVRGCNGSVVFNGITYTASTTVEDTVKSVLGCDSLYRTNTIIVENVVPVLTTTNLSGCGSVVYNGTVYTSPTVLQDTLKSVGGCDSIYRKVVISIVITPTTNNVVLRNCGSLVYNGVTYTASTTLRDTVRTSGGCDSIYNVTSIIIQNIVPVVSNAVFRGCNGSVVFNGTTYTASTIIRDTVRSSNGCDSIYNVNNIVVQNINPVTRNVLLSDCQSIVYNGVTYTTSTVVRDTVKSVLGCDSVYKIVTITIKAPVTVNSAFSGCDSVVYNGVKYFNSIVFRDTLKSVSGCDSVYNIVTINVQKIIVTAQSFTIAGCNSLTLNGVTYTASTVLRDTLRSIGGCDSIYRTTNIIVQNITPVTSNLVLSGCGSVVYQGITYTASTVVRDTTRSIGGCDSLYRITTIDVVVPTSVVTTLKGCNSLVFNGTTYTASTVIKDTVKSAGGCDSLYRTTNISIQTITPVSGNNVVAGCNTVVFKGITYTASATVKDTLKSSFGCDSIYRTNYIVVQNITPVSFNTTLNGCGSVVFNGVTYTASAVVKDTVKSIGGCDSLFRTTTITVVTPVAVTNNLQGCNSIVFNGVTYTASSVVKDTVKSISGCDSLYRITNINVQTITPVNGSNVVAGCNSVVFNGVTYTSSAIIKDTLKTTRGCDSIFRTNYIVVQNITPVSFNTSLNGCGSVVFNGVTYTASTVVKDTVKSIGGCDSLFRTTAINVVTPVAVTNNLQGCNSIVFNGITYTASAVVKDTVKSISGCDSLYRTTNINVQIITPVNGSNVVAGCNSVVFNGVTYTSSAIVKDTLKTTLGCDSIFRTNYIVVQNVTPVAANAAVSGCGSVVFNGITYTASTIVTDTVKSIGGCDSLFRTTTITVINPVTVTNNLQGCNSLVFNGVTYTASAVVMDTVKSAGGCDSLYRTTNINIQTITPVNGSNVVAGCNSVVFNGVTYTSSTTVQDTLRTTLGCDSIFRTNYIVVQNITPVSTSLFFNGCGSYVYNGVTYTASTVVRDTTKSIGGCDSLYNTVTIAIVTPVTVNIKLIGCNSLVYKGVTYTISTIVRDTVKSVTGCDSLFNVVSINIQTISPVAATNPIKGCGSVVFNGVTYTASTTVLDTVKSSFGCDSIYRTNVITIQNITPITNNGAKSGCDRVVFNGVTYTASTIVRDTVKSSAGCDSIYNVTAITVNTFNLSLSTSPNPVQAGSQVTLTTSASVPYTVSSWSPAAMFANQTALSQTVRIDSNKTVIVIGTSSAGCVDTASLTINVNYLDQVFVPNTFTPNNDGRNDEFKVYGNNISAVDMKIFNQWGQLIFSSSDPSRGWNGTFNGQMQPTGVYVYVVKVTLTNNTVINKKGSINLIK